MIEKHCIGVYATKLKDGTPSFRASITYNGKHISLGSFDNEHKASLVYKDAQKILNDSSITIDKYDKKLNIPFEKYICLINFRDTGMYISNPIHLEKNFFTYHLSPDYVLKFDIEDLFYYSSHKIMKRGSHLFVADYGSQLSVLQRYGIKSYAVEGRDYHFLNDDPTDLRYDNIVIFNRYRGVLQFVEKGLIKYKAVIHVKSNYVIGRYKTEVEAAIAYNKAVDLLIKNGIKKNFQMNYIDGLSASQYADIYRKLKMSPKLLRIKNKD
ncbi:hypothetical protein [Butyrivibrio sp. YAB3001]|uniref:hypothetical protein n=1 Tax=Butyrivibrio sp. YAB3001 TaxID=1520812 RepID=UPI0008F6357A|nr:hypothetical protein [Butyrivibrio sp. YAB3001]SFB73732.1 hypothetical protein SAMN02910398_00526 [Butyrivibrio sp. YAB3001]